MRHFDHTFVTEVMTRLSTIKADTPPQWGVLTPSTLVQHLVFSVKYSMGRLGNGKVYGNWYLRTIIGPLILNGYLPIRKSVPLPKSWLALQQEQTQADLETLHAVLEEYLGLVQAGELAPAPHPVFGPIGVDGWDKMHVRHFEHHLRQFSA